MGATELRCHEVVYRANGRLILDGVSVRAESGEMVAVTGPSGAGKSTLLAILGGLELPTSGEVLLDKAPVVVGDLALRRRVSVVLQGYGLVAALTAAENVALALQARALPRRQARIHTEAALAAVGLSAQGDHLLEQLSGGQQQRVALARAFVTDPDVLLADEPTAELDADTRVVVMGLLREKARNGAIVVVASHDPEVTEACDREFALADGRSSTGMAALS